MGESKSRFDAVLFDLDGTLADSIGDLTASINHVRGKMGLPPVAVPVVQSYVGDGVRRLMQRALQTENQATIDEALAIHKPYYEAHCLDQTVLYPGIWPMLKGLAARRIPLGVVSNKVAAPSELILKGLRIRHFFMAVVGGDTTPHRKPDPRPLQAAVKRLPLPLTRILVVGDSPNDVLGAQRAGYTSCAVTWGFGAEDAILAAHPDHLIRKPEELLPILVPQ